MRVIIQRVKHCSVKINNTIYSNINNGLLVLLGIEDSDGPEDCDWLSKKIAGLRIFNDADAKLNLNVNEINGEVLIVSQFTLYASTKKGNRPSFLQSAKPETAMPLYENFIHKMQTHIVKPVKTGCFGADMQLELINDGPVTIIIDSKNKE